MEGDIIYIPIVKASVRFNPNAGSMQDVVPGHMTMEISGKCDEKTLKELQDSYYKTSNGKVDVKLVGYSTQFAATKTYRFTAVVYSELTSERTIRYLELKFGRGIMWKINFDHQVIHLMEAERPYLYNYKKVKFLCPHCGMGPLSVDTLAKETRYDGDGDECGNDSVCPHCREEIEITYQNLTDTDLCELAEKNKANRAKTKKA